MGKLRHAKKSSKALPAGNRSAPLLGRFSAECRKEQDVKIFFVSLEQTWEVNNCPVHLFGKYRPKAEAWLSYRVPTLHEKGVVVMLQFCGFGAPNDFQPLPSGTALKQVTTKLWLLKRTEFLKDYARVMMEAGLARIPGWTENMECLNNLGVWLSFRKGQ